MTTSMVGSEVGGGLTMRGRPSQKGVSPYFPTKRDTHTGSPDAGSFPQTSHSGAASSGARALEVVITADAINDAANHAVSGVAITNIGPIADFNASSSDLQGNPPPSSIPGQSVNGVRSKVSILAHGGPFPTTVSSGKHIDKEI